MIKINCETKDTLKLDELTEFQGELKKRTDADYGKIIRTIKKHGFSFPFFVWKDGKTNYIMDGHGRFNALVALKRKGEEMPESFPVVYVNAQDESEAKELLLKLNSQYGKMTKDSVASFLGDLEINFEDLQLPNGVLELDRPEVDENPYTTKIETPIYEIKGDNPGFREMVDTTKYDSLCKEIDASELPEDQKKFLKLAATRHIQFHYGKIAEYYAHQDEEMQNLMENSALVIIDYEKALELGYVKMTQDLENLLGGEDDA